MTNKKTSYVLFLAASLVTLVMSPASAQSYDWRNIKHGNPIFSNGYCDQPYVVVLDNGTWLCVFTTNASHEGSGGQHIVSCTSTDQGKSRSVPDN